MKKIAWIILETLIIIISIITITSIYSNNSRINRVVEDIKNTYNDVLSNSCFYVLTLSNGHEMPHVAYSEDIGLFKRAWLQYSDIDINNCYIKIDVAYNKKEIQKENFKDYIISGMDNRLCKNILINEKFVLLNSEINFNNLVNFRNKELNDKAVSSYIKRRDDVDIGNITKIEFFDSYSSFMDNDSKIYHLSSKDKNFHIREEALNTDEIQLALNSSKNMLFKMLKENGEFVYGYNIIDNTEYKDYNILRHSLAIWSLVRNFELDELEKAKVEKAIEYLISTIVYKDDCAFVVEEVANYSKIKLGANGVALTALCEYMNKYDSKKYIEIATKIGNGIIYCQNEDGSFNHLFNPKTFDIDTKFYTILYDGEATLGLCKLYSLTNEEKYYNSAKKAMDYFIKNDFTNYNDHWMSYASNEFTKIDNDEKYIEFAIKNVADNIDKLKYQNSTHHASFEQLFECYELYKRALANGIHLEIMDSFSLKELEELIQYRTELEYGAIMLPESAIYTKEPSKYMNIFYLRNDLSVKIDDIAHYINAFTKLESFTKVYSS